MSYYLSMISDSISISFVATNVQVTGTLPIIIAPGHVFRRAFSHEIKWFEELLNNFLNLPARAFEYNSKTLKTNVSDEQFSYNTVELPESEWKYWVVESEPRSYDKISEIKRLFLLLPVDLDFAFTIYANHEKPLGFPGYLPAHVRQIYRLENLTDGLPPALITQKIASIGDLLDCYEKIKDDPGYSFIKHALDNFEVVRTISDELAIKGVGLFSIIESLVSHKPDLKDPHESITKQIQNKMALLRKRYSRKIPMNEYFDKANEDTTWSKLYGYRSAIAHGDPVSFSPKGYKILRDHKTVIRFLSENIKELILFALKDPEFISDLRKC
jgi:Apea-like HEPN